MISIQSIKPYFHVPLNDDPTKILIISKFQSPKDRSSFGLECFT